MEEFSEILSHYHYHYHFFWENLKEIIKGILGIFESSKTVQFRTLFIKIQNINSVGAGIWKKYYCCYSLTDLWVSVTCRKLNRFRYTLEMNFVQL